MFRSTSPFRENGTTPGNSRLESPVMRIDKNLIFFTLLCSLLVAGCDIKKPKAGHLISVDEAQQAGIVVAEGESRRTPLRALFEIKNLGDEACELSVEEKSCGCVKVEAGEPLVSGSLRELDKEKAITIPKDGVLKVTLAGEAQTAPTVRSMSAKLIARFSGGTIYRQEVGKRFTVVKPLSVEPPTLRIENKKDHERLKLTVTAYSKNGIDEGCAPVLRKLPPYVAWHIDPEHQQEVVSKSGDLRKIRWTVWLDVKGTRDDGQAEPQNAEFALSCGGPPYVSVPVVIYEKTDFVVAPSKLSFRSDGALPLHKSVLLRSSTEGDFVVDDAYVEGGGRFEVSASKGKRSNIHVINVIYKPGTKGVHETVCAVKVSSDRISRVIRIPIVGHIE